MDLRWIPSTELSGLHAAVTARQSLPFTNESLRAAIEEPSNRLFAAARMANLDDEQFVRHLQSQSLHYPGSQELAARVLKRANPARATPDNISLLGAAIAECRSVFNHSFPRLAEELNLRIGPLQSMWEARGPGLLAMIGNLTEPDMIAESASVILVQPVVGGFGAAHLDTNCVHIEALLTDPLPQLPEILRLAWLLAQLQLDRPIYGEQVHGWKLPAVAARALLPITLAAAEELQVSSNTAPNIEAALMQWLKLSSDDAAHEQNVIFAWWETQRDANYDWATALAALSAMLAA
ncbi:MAG: hypothetical protein U0892_06790 [Pirellulales bacterium]